MTRLRTRSTSRMERLDRLESIAKQGRRNRLRRFKLSSLLVTVSIFCVMLAILGFLWPTFVGELGDKFNRTAAAVPEAPLTETLIPMSVTLGLVFGPLVAYAVYRLGSLKGFYVFCGFVCLGLVALITAMILDIEPFSDTPLKHISTGQSVYIILLSCGLLLPLASFAGWYLSISSLKSAYR